VETVAEEGRMLESCEFFSNTSFVVDGRRKIAESRSRFDVELSWGKTGDLREPVG
jgi:hypothetical protein